MKRATTPSYVLEFPLRVGNKQARVLEVRLEAGRNLYNAVLGEAIKRAKILKSLPEYKEAITYLKARDREKARELFKKARKLAGFDYSLIQKWGIRCKNACWIGNHLDTHTAQKVMERAYNAVNEWVLGKRGKPRFKPRGRFRSLENKSNSSGIRLRGSYEELDLRIEWNGLVLPLKLKKRALKDAKAKFAFANHPVKYCRIIRRRIGLRFRYFVQVVFRGRPWREWKRPIAEVLGLDFGPSFVAYASKQESGFFSPSLFFSIKELARKKRILQRKLDRQRRANNPENYNEDGMVKKGRKRWRKSKKMRQTEARLANIDRKLRGARRTAIGKFANKLINLAKVIRFEDNSFKAFQRRFGRSVNGNGLGMLVGFLAYKAESAGRLVEPVPESLALSQKCVCGRKVKKSLKDRVHVCPKCGFVFQRDMLSAYLVAHAGEAERPDDMWLASMFEGWEQGFRIVPGYITGPFAGYVLAREQLKQAQAVSTGESGGAGTGADPSAASGLNDNLRGAVLRTVRPGMHPWDRAGSSEIGRPRPSSPDAETGGRGRGLPLG